MASGDAAASAAAATRLFCAEYSPGLYQALSDDRVRVDAYRRALERRVRGKRVLDLGTGPVALLAVLAARAGAARVIAVEVSEEVAAAARRCVEAEGLAGVIEVIVGYSTQAAFPEVDVVIHELVGSLASEEGIALVLDDIRQRVPAVIDAGRPKWAIPRRTATWVAPISLHVPCAGAAGERGRARGRAPQARELRLPVGFVVPSAARLGEPKEAEACDAEQLPALEERRELRWTIAGASTLTGFVCAPRIELDDVDTIDAWKEQTHWRHVALLLPSARLLAAGDEVALRVATDRQRFPVVFSFEARLRQRNGASELLLAEAVVAMEVPDEPAEALPAAPAERAAARKRPAAASVGAVAKRRPAAAAAMRRPSGAGCR